MTRGRFLEVYRAQVVASYPWADDAERLARFLASARETISTDRTTWNFDGPCTRAAWKLIGGKGRPTLKALRALPLGFEVAILDGAEPEGADLMLATDDQDLPIRFVTEAAAVEWAEANYPAWIVANMGDGHDWKRFGFRVREAAP